MSAHREPLDEPHDVLAADEFALGSADPALHQDEPHDVLAAEEFAMPAPDPDLHQDEVRDVLAAEEFAMPAPDPALHPDPIVLPPDPTGIAEPHDVLAAEEFAMPAAPAGSSVPLRTGWPLSSRLLLVAVAGVVAVALRRLHHR